MRILKFSALLFVILIIAIQFIRPKRISISNVTANDISAVMLVNDDVQAILKKACYDCHSNNPIYPWYFNIQPVGWFMAGHISEAREELNFNEFGSYPPRDQASKLLGIINEVEDDEMPIASYRLMHKDARLNEAEKKVLVDWAEMGKESFRNAKSE